MLHQQEFEKNGKKIMFLSLEIEHAIMGFRGSSMNYYVITAVHLDNLELIKDKAYRASADFTMFFPSPGVHQKINDHPNPAGRCSL
jgi:hypothetical protein